MNRIFVSGGTQIQQNAQQGLKIKPKKLTRFGEVSDKLLFQNSSEVKRWSPKYYGSHRWLPIHFALLNQDLTQLQKSIHNDADLYVKTKKGENLLHFAIATQCGSEIIQFLIDKGLNKDARFKDPHGMTWSALTYAKHFRHKSGVKVLRQNGAAYPLKDRWSMLKRLVNQYRLASFQKKPSLS